MVYVRERKEYRIWAFISTTLWRYSQNHCCPWITKSRKSWKAICEWYDCVRIIFKIIEFVSFSGDLSITDCNSWKGWTEEWCSIENDNNIEGWCSVDSPAICNCHCDRVSPRSCWGKCSNSKLGPGERYKCRLCWCTSLYPSKDYSVSIRINIIWYVKRIGIRSLYESYTNQVIIKCGCIISHYSQLESEIYYRISAIIESYLHAKCVCSFS